ncbi:MerR family transcriptional regulator [Nocardia sp. NPDC057353]|uniref:MerR family transcriptional regulator n=1 Tax=Nocardia sp. NPDC057353 TaxID=3346104 RepID=UPI00363E02A0
METFIASTRESDHPTLHYGTAQLARRARCSAQHVRDLEAAGVLPPARRAANGYRRYGATHLHCLLAYRALAGAVGPVAAKELLRALHREPRDAVLARLDAAHAGLHRERAELAAATVAAAAVAAEPVPDPRPADAMGIAELAAALGIRASALRHWEAEGLIGPDRDRTGTRRYTPVQVRDVRIVHQLREAGYRIGAVRAVLAGLPRGGTATVTAALAARERDIATRSLALLTAAAALAPLCADAHVLAAPLGQPDMTDLSPPTGAGQGMLDGAAIVE